jgi:hypothetical protein
MKSEKSLHAHTRRDLNRRNAACKIAQYNRGFIINYYSSRLYGGPLKNIPTMVSGEKCPPSEQPWMKGACIIFFIFTAFISYPSSPKYVLAFNSLCS